MAWNRQSKAAAALEQLRQANDALHRWRPRPSRVADIRRSLFRRIVSVLEEPVPAAPSPADPSPADPSPPDRAGREPLPRLEPPERPRPPIDVVPFGTGRQPRTLWSRTAFRVRRLDRAVRRAVAQLGWRLSLLRFWYRRRR